jgi:8-oxo-dGTP pyrophosphatase MutT (NUDIX family)
MSKLTPDALKHTLNSYITAAKSQIDHDTIVGVQTILWIVGNHKQEIADTLTIQTRYLTLEKNTEKSKGKIVFPSGTVDGHEIEKGELTANGLMMAAMRELHEETF